MKIQKVKALLGFVVFGFALGVSGCGVLDLLTENTQDANGRHSVIATTSQSASMTSALSSVQIIRGPAVTPAK